MPRLLLSLIAAVALMCAALPAQADDRSDLLALEARWNQALVDQDIPTLETILADDFVFVAPDGSITGREALLSFVANRTVTLDPFVTEEVSVRTYGDTSVVVGRFTQTIRRGDEHRTTTYRYTDVYVRQAGAWRAVSAQSAIIPGA